MHSISLLRALLLILLVMAIVPFLGKWFSLVLDGLGATRKLLVHEFVNLDARHEGLLLELVLLLLEISQLWVCLLLLHEALRVVRSVFLLHYVVGLWTGRLIDASGLDELFEFVLIGLGPVASLIGLISTLATLQTLSGCVLILNSGRSDLRVVGLIFENLNASGDFLNAAGAWPQASSVPDCGLTVLSLLFGSQGAIRLVILLSLSRRILKVLALRDVGLAHYSLEPLRNQLMGKLRRTLSLLRFGCIIHFILILNIL